MPKKTKSFLPRGYLSETQMSLVENNPKEYIQRYLYGKEQKETAYLRLGKIVADVLEHKRDGHVRAELMRDIIPSYPKNNVEIRTTLKQGKDEVELLGYLDAYDPKKGIQADYKTGTYPWSQKKAQDLPQLKTYALIHYKNHGKIPKQELIWLETKFNKENYNELELTGNFLVHTVQRTMKDILEAEARVWKAYKKIKKLVAEEIGKL